MDPLDIRLIALVAALVSIGAAVCVRHPRYVLPGAVGIGVFTSRPSVVGERLPFLGPAVLTACALACVVIALKRRSSAPNRRHYMFVIWALTWVWLGVHRFLVPTAEEKIVTSTFTAFLPVLAFYFVVRDRDLLLRTRNALVALQVAVSASMVVSALAFATIGASAVRLTSLPLGYVDSDLDLFFPASLSYGTGDAGTFPRLLGIGREPGMGALVIGWAYFAMPNEFRARNLCRAVLVLSLLTTQSTAGLGIFGACFVLAQVLGRPRFSPWIAIAGLLAGSAIVYISVYSADFGLLAKAESGTDSFSERTAAALAGLEALVAEPFTAESTAPLSSINLFASIAVSGAPWFVLMSAFLLAPVLRSGRRNPVTYGALFVLLTMLTSQPLAGNVAIFVLTLVSHYSVERRATSRTWPEEVGSDRPSSALATARRPPAPIAHPSNRPVERVGS